MPCAIRTTIARRSRIRFSSTPTRTASATSAIRAPRSPASTSSAPRSRCRSSAIPRATSASEIRGSATIDEKPPLDPSKTGLLIQLLDGLGGTTIDVTLPAVALDPSDQGRLEAPGRQCLAVQGRHEGAAGRHPARHPEGRSARRRHRSLLHQRAQRDVSTSGRCAGHAEPRLRRAARTGRPVPADPVQRRRRGTALPVRRRGHPLRLPLSDRRSAAPARRTAPRGGA